MKKYLYVINYPKYEEELCMMELRALFGEETKEKYLLSDIYVNPSRSPFLKEVLIIKAVSEDFSNIIEYIKDNNIAYDDFKVAYIKLQKDDVSYSKRLDKIREIGMNISGIANIHEPKVMLAVTRLGDKWIYADYERNDFQWHIHEDKPNNYSNSLGVRMARALVNIAVGREKDISLVDPCCGIGTVVIEAASMDIKVKGYEINKQIAARARRNLEFFGYDRNLITPMDMHKVEEKYDVAIIDLPYGLFTPITGDEQRMLINSAYKMADKLILVVFEDMIKIIEEAGFNIVESCTVNKGKFKRYIHVCCRL